MSDEYRCFKDNPLHMYELVLSTKGIVVWSVAAISVVKKSVGFQNMCHSAIGMEHKLIHGQRVIFETSINITHK